MKTPRLPPSSTLDPAEWDFRESKVPDDQLVACCYWEYGRESRTILEVFADIDRLNPADGPSRGAASILANQWGGTSGKCLYLQSQVLECSKPLWIAWVSLKDPASKPWQSQANRRRREIARQMKPMSPADLVPPAFTAVTCFNSLPGFQGAGLSAPCVEVNSERGFQRFLAQIAWSEFTDREIVQSFEGWVHDNRPNGMGQPDRRGRRDWRAKLDRLAVMRLLHHFTLSEMRNGCPEAWRRWGGDQLGRRTAELDWYRHRKEAKDVFQQLFPFLNETLIHWNTKGGH